MGKCITVYLGTNGREHPAYYNVFKHSGHKAALSSYLKAMESVLSANLQVGTIDDLYAMSKRVKRDNLNRKKNLNGGPTNTKKLIGLNTAETAEMAKNIVLYNHAMERLKRLGIYERYTQLGKTSKYRTTEDEKAHSLKYFESTEEKKEVFNNLVKRMINKWSADQTEKAKYHQLIEHFVQYRVSMHKKGRSIPDSVKEYIDKEGPFDYLKESIITQMDTFISSIYRTNPNAIIEPEMGIDVEGWNNRGIMDLYVHYPRDPKKNRPAYTKVFDYKFYSESSFKSYANEQRGHLKGAAQRLHNNARDVNALQLSEYIRMLAEYGDTNVRGEIIPFILEVDEEGSTEDKTKYLDIKMKRGIPTSYLKTEIEEILSEEKIGIDIEIQNNKRYSEDKISTAATFYAALLSKSKLTSSVVISSRNSIQSINVDVDKDGIHTFYNDQLGQRSVVRGDTKKEREEFLLEYIKLREQFSARVVDEVINFYNSGKATWSPSNAKIKGTSKSLGDYMREFGEDKLDSPDEREKFYKELKKKFSAPLATKSIEGSVRQLLQGIKPGEHTMERLANDPRFKDLPKDIIKVTNTVTGVVRLLSISPTSYSSMRFDHGNKKSYNNVLGAWIDDKEASRRLIKKKDMQYNVEHLMMALVMKEMKYDDPTLVFSSPKTKVLKNKTTPPRSGNLGELDHILSEVADIIPDSEMTEEFKEILQIKTNSFTPEGSNDMVSHYSMELEEMFEKENLLGRKTLQQYSVDTIKNLQNLRIGSADTYGQLINSLHDLKRAMDVEFDDGRIEGERADTSEYIKITNLIMALDGMDPKLSWGDKDLKDSGILRLTSMGSVNHPYFTRLDEIYKKAKLSIQDGFWSLKGKHDKLVREYMASEGVTRNSQGLELKNQLFRKLYKDTELDSPNAVLSNLMVLKSESELPSKQARALVRYMIEVSDQMMEDHLGKDEFIKFKRTDNYVKGMMPVQKISMRSAAEEKTSTMEDRLKRMKKALFGKSKEKKEERDTRFDYSIANPFMQQIQDHDMRMHVAGYTNEGLLQDEDSKVELEYNMDVLFDSVVLNNLTQKYYETALMYKSAAEISLMVQEREGDVRTSRLQDALNGFTNLILRESIDNPFQEDGDFWTRGSSFTSKVVLGGSLSFMIAETTINSINMMAETTNQYLTKLFLGDDVGMDFTAANMIEAAKLYTTEHALTYALGLRYNMIVRDPGKLATERFHKSQSMLTSKVWNWANSFSIETSQTIVLIAKMLNDGSYTAHSLNADGQIIYDEKKDKRFYAQNGETLSDEEKKRRKLKRDYYAKVLANENGMNKNGTIKNALVHDDIILVQTLTTERLASLSSDQKVLVEGVALGIAFMRFKSWMVSKKEVYWKQYNAYSKLKKRVAWITDEAMEDGGYWTHLGEPSEGILNTLLALPALMSDMGFTSIGADSKLPPGLALVRKKNLIRLLNDLLLTALLASIFTKIFEKDKFLKLDEETGEMAEIEIPRGEMAESLHRILGNTLYDMTFIYPLYSSLLGNNSSLLPVLSVLKRGVMGTLGMFQGGFEGDFTQVMGHVDGVMRTSGFYRGVSDFGIPTVKKIIDTEE